MNTSFFSILPVINTINTLDVNLVCVWIFLGSIMYCLKN